MGVPKVNERLPSLQFAAAPFAASGGDPTGRMWRTWRRHVRLFLLCFFGVLILGFGLIAVLKPTYTATAIVAIPPQNVDPLAPPGQQPVGVVDDSASATQAASMMSRDVAALVLAQYPPVPGKHSFSVGKLLCRAGVSPACKPAVKTDPEAVRQAEIDAFLTTLTVVPELRSDAIDVGVTAKTAASAAALADAVVTNYQHLSIARQTDDVNRVAAWLDGRTAELQQRWLEAVNMANAYSVANGLTNSSSGAGQEPLVQTQIASMAASLSTAQAQLAAAQAQAVSLHDARRHGDTSALVSLSTQPILVEAANSLMELESQRDQLAAEFGPNYPKLQALDQQIASTKATLEGQTGTAIGSINQNLVAAQAEVKQLTENLNLLKSQASSQGAANTEYASLLDEATSAKTIYEAFVEHENDVVDRASLLEPPVAFISHAGVPHKPTFPNIPKLAIGVVVLALVSGVAATFIKDYLSLGFVEMDEITASVSLPILATLPQLRQRGGRTAALHILDEPFSRTSEAVRGVAAKLAMMPGFGGQPRAVLVASAGANEGKTTFAVWLATTVRQGGQAVLVIDGDYRRISASDANVLKPNTLGFTDLLSEQATPAEVIRRDVVTGVDYISAGAAITRPFGGAEIERLRTLIATLKQSYGLIVIDSPPLLATTDGLVHGNVVDQTVFICRWQTTSRKAVIASVGRLRAYGANIVGVVVTMVNWDAALASGGEYSQREIKLINQLYGS